MKDEGKIVIWPVNINKAKTRKGGRIISRKSSVQNPTLQEITTAAQKLGMEPVVQEDKKYPGSWWEGSGRILIEKSEPKPMIARKLSRQIKDLRGN